MKSNVGLWIDFEEAIIVRVVDDVEEFHTVKSETTNRDNLSVDAHEKQDDLHSIKHSDEYYDKIMPHLHNTDVIFIFGPGEAKCEFEKHLAVKSLGARIIGIESTDKMTHQQIAAKVQEHFLTLSNQ